MPHRWVASLVLVAVAMSTTARGADKHFSVSGGGNTYLPVFGAFVDIEILRGTADFDTETGRFEMTVTKRATSRLIGTVELTSTIVISPDRVSGSDIEFDVAQTSFVISACKSIERFDCTRPQIQVGVPRPWKYLFGSARDVRLSFAGETRDFVGTATTMPVRIADGSALRIVYVDKVVEVIDYHLAENPRAGFGSAVP
jgi:hypothetical protein